MIIVIGYNVVRGGIVREQIRFSEFSRPWISSYDKLAEYRTHLTKKHTVSEKEAVSICLITVDPPLTDPKIQAINMFLSGGADSLATVAKKYNLSTKTLRSIIADYVKRSNYVREINNEDSE